jgi:hypothetical protein
VQDALDLREEPLHQPEVAARDPGNRRQRFGIGEPAHEYSRLGGCGIAVRCDHPHEAQVAALVAAWLA